MATGINCMQLLITFLCIACVLTLGGAINGIPPETNCISKGPCAKYSDYCAVFCSNTGFARGGKCNEDGVCCCHE
ncbi:LCR-like protein [Medicago truncatula]|uniref:LCR-like protein n=1 Tax=Medicago truncatula TaxID=3880 RepID=G7IJG7_MEDTR|nr:LCR-like protein [Medicago truncatula]